jgi:hypothetical protein
MLRGCLKESVGFARQACVSFKLPRSLGEELNHEKLHFRMCELSFFNGMLIKKTGGFFHLFKTAGFAIAYF